MPQVIHYTTEAEWLDLKLDDVTSTESPALFGLSPYLTEFELFHYKSTRTSPDFDIIDRMKWGKRLEAVIAEGIAEDLGLTIRPLKEYMRHSTVKGMGSSFDYAILGHQDGPGLMEVKNVDSLVYRREWSEDEAPAHIETQVQHQMEVADVNWCMIAVFCGGTRPYVIRRERDREVGKVLCQRVEKFWRDVKSGHAPTPDFIKDAEFIISLHQSAGVKVLEADETVATMLAEYAHLTAEAKSYGELKDAKKAEILLTIGDDYNKVKAGPFTLSCGMVKDTPPTLITPEMVGQTYGGRKGYRGFKLTEKREKE